MKNSYIAKRHWKAQSNAMGKSDEVAKSFDDCINLSLGDPDLITDRLIIDKAYEDSCAGYTHYANFRETRNCAMKLSSFIRKNTIWT